MDSVPQMLRTNADKIPEYQVWKSSVKILVFISLEYTKNFPLQYRKLRYGGIFADVIFSISKTAG